MLALGLKEGAVVVSDLKQSEEGRVYGNGTFLSACIIVPKVFRVAYKEWATSTCLLGDYQVLS